MSSTTLAILQPGLALTGWTFVMEAWMYATRLPAISKYNVQMSPNATTADLNARIPRPIQWKADNYNHLHEQPTLFYFVLGALALTHSSSSLTSAPTSSTFGTITSTEDLQLEMTLAWAYVGARVVHSLVQALGNRIMVRFGVFAVSSGLLAGLWARVAMAAF